MYTLYKIVEEIITIVLSNKMVLLLPYWVDSSTFRINYNITKPYYLHYRWGKQI